MHFSESRKFQKVLRRMDVRSQTSSSQRSTPSFRRSRRLGTSLQVSTFESSRQRLSKVKPTNIFLYNARITTYSWAQSILKSELSRSRVVFFLFQRINYCGTLENKTIINLPRLAKIYRILLMLIITFN